jgi:hypothetical protein
MDEAQLAEFAAGIALPEDSATMEEADEATQAKQDPFSKSMLEKYPLPGGLDDESLADILRKEILEGRREMVQLRLLEKNLKIHRERIEQEKWCVSPLPLYSQPHAG